MKKYIYLTILSIFMLTGCGAGATKTTSCFYKTTSGNVTTKITYNIDHMDDVVKKVKISYDYHMNDDTPMDGVGTGTDGTTNDTIDDRDGIIDGVVGSAIDSVINGVTSTILDIAGLRDRHLDAQNRFGNINGFSVQNTSDQTDNDYHVTYIVDYDMISDTDLATLNLTRDINSLKRNYTAQGFSCSE